MAKNLVIVESPTKTRTLSNFLGKNFSIMATVGHVKDLPKSKLGVDVDNDFEPQYVTIKGKEKVLRELRKAAKTADNIYLAPDPDREGEAIAWHVANMLEGKIKGKLSRVTFNEITKLAVNEAISNPREINVNLVNAQQARRVLDRIVGYTVSPFLWKVISYNLSAGRVQSVALRLVCEREAEIDAFNPQEYWQIAALLDTKDKTRFTARLFKVDEQTVGSPADSGDKKLVIENEKQVKEYLAEIKKADFTVASVKTTERTRKPLPPFITSTLQQEAAKAFGFSPKRTMTLAQQLYEGIEVSGEGTTGLITYMRTDSTRLSGEALSAARAFIEKNYGKDYLPNKPIQYGKKKGSQDAHEAIRPTYLTLPPEKVRKKLTPQQLKLYTLIWNRFLGSQMNPARYTVQTVDIEAGRFTFRVTAQSLKFDGFLKVYHEEKEQDENGSGDSYGNGALNLPPMKEGETLSLHKLEETQSFTRPPARYSEATLVKQLEADGIGRPSTYASIVSTLLDRKYVESVERRLAPTELGKTINKLLVNHFPDLFNVEFTANMERELDLVEEGEDDWVKVLRDFYAPFIKKVDSLKERQNEIKESMTEETDIKCEKCGSPMIIKWGRNGRFLACSAYPECKSTRPLPEEEAQNQTDEVCEKCGSPMVIKTGRYGRFMACSAYPDCKNTKPVSLGIECPKEGCDGKVIEKQARGRRLFYGCSNYPKCDYASWDKPVKKECPACNNPFMVLKISKVKGEFLRCPQCKNEVADTTPDEQPEKKTEKSTGK